MKRFCFVAFLLLLLVSGSTAQAARMVIAPIADELVIYNWNDYIGRTTIADFTRITGIKVIYKQYSTNEEMEKGVNTGRGQYDIVVPTARPYFARLIQGNLLKPLDKAKIPNLSFLDSKLMQSMHDIDPGNKYGVIYAWGTNGIGYNTEAIKKRMPEAPVHSWDMLFNPNIVRKFADCGVTIVNSGYEVIPLMLQYLGLNPKSERPEDLQAAEEALMRIRPYIRKFDSSDYINALADGRVCLALGWSGDILQARARAAQAKKGVALEYNIPKEGSMMWFDMIGVLRDAPHPDAAYKFINFILDPDNMASITNDVAYANAVPASLAKVKAEVKNDPDVFPTDEIRGHLFIVNQPSPSYEKLRQRAWERIVAGG